MTNLASIYKEKKDYAKVEKNIVKAMKIYNEIYNKNSEKKYLNRSKPHYHTSKVDSGAMKPMMEESLESFSGEENESQDDDSSYKLDSSMEETPNLTKLVAKRQIKKKEVIFT